MGVRQLEEFLGQADQKGFWIFTYANLGGGFLGAFIGNSLIEMVAPPLKLLGILFGVLLGVMTTWKVKGHPIYRWALSYATFILRRYLKIGLGDFTIDAAFYYRARAVKHEPFMLVATRDGKPVPVLVHRGSGSGSSADLFDGLFVPPAEERAWASVPGAQPSQAHGVGTDASIKPRSASSNGHLHQPPVGDDRLDSDYGDWNL
ncbi:MAG: hypothetical protein IVW55_00510 [Chloroflexi bacterium]|nr:hypothetical protein [Chloroflexota bacterium]